MESGWTCQARCLGYEVIIDRYTGEYNCGDIYVIERQLYCTARLPNTRDSTIYCPNAYTPWS